jgi:hypothetical protein
MANLSNINNKLIVTDGGNLLVNATANLATYGGITIDNFSDPSIAMKTTGTSGWLWTQYITSTGTNNFSMGVNQSSPYWCVKAGAGMDSPHLVVDSSGDVGIGMIAPETKLDVSGTIKNYATQSASTWLQGNGGGLNYGMDIFLTNDLGSTQGATRLRSAYGGIGTAGMPNFSISRSTQTQVYGNNPNELNYSEALVIDGSSGNVGIGTITPDALLELSKSVANAQGATLRLTNAVGGAGAGVAVEFVGPGTQPIHAKIITEDAGAYDSDLIFQTKVTGTGGALVDRLIIDENGDVGINTTPRTSANKKLLSIDSAWGGQLDIGVNGTSHAQFGTDNYSSGAKCRIQSASSIAFKVNGGTLVETIDSAGSIAIGGFIPSGTPTGDYRSLEIGRQGNTITGSPFKSALYLSTNATITAGSTQFTYRNSSTPAIFQGMESNGDLTFSNAASGTAGGNISFTERMRIFLDGDITMGQFVTTQAPANGILKIRTSGSTANVCYPLLYIGGSTHLATRQYGIGFDPEGYTDRMKMFFGADGMGNGYSYGDFVWNINTTANNDTVTPANEKMRLDKGGDLKLKTGNLAITDTSKGILLGGTGTANQLRIYQHGTWAPQIYYQNATDQANATNSTQVGLYTRIGNMCMVQFRLIWIQASGTPAVDNCGIKNLPFQGNATNTYAEVLCFIKNYTGGPSPRGNLTLTLPGANSPIALFNDTNFVGNMGNAIGSGTKEIRFSFTYTTNG